MATKYPGGSRFEPTELGLVKRYLKNKVEKNDSDCIKTLNVYGDAPWLLHHDTNPLYARNEWYYFVPRTVRGVKTVSRMVPGNGESFLGGTWKSVGKRKEIKKNKELKGYKRVLVFNKNVAGKLEKEKTDWHMDEYSLHKNGDEFHDLVLCHVRLLNSAERFKPLVPPAHQLDDNNDNHVLPNQEQQEAGFAMQEYKGGDVNQHQQQQEEEQEDSRMPLQSNYNQGQYLLEANVCQNDMMMLENDRGYLNQHQHQQQQQQQQEQEGSLILSHPPLEINNNQEPCPSDDLAYHGAKDDMTGYGLMPNFNDANQQHEQQQDSPTLLHPPLQINDNQEHHPLEDYAFDGADDNVTFDIDELLNSLDEWKEQEDSPPSLLFPPLQSNDNHGQCPPLVPSQVENHNNTVVPNQEQREALGFANQNDMPMIKKERGDDVEQQQQQQDQEQLQKVLMSFLLAPSWDTDFIFDEADAEDDFIKEILDVHCTQEQLQELEEEQSKALQRVPQAQDSGVRADQVMPKESSQGFLFTNTQT
ncbi:uncharacterized protein LOC108842514 [Raphanus sativus]|uniref:Uncharacterized protein LOC108842514 n=1 Tax=Raphanus sativus TaxID=3726 RepID=A0A6J0MFR8_RAPSA|nr:uncharacterized protein LOC108842514 [Raphanus sativus]